MHPLRMDMGGAILVRRNPWQARHAADETVFQGGNSRLAAQIVAGEYAGTEEYDTDCGKCGSAAYYRATVGAVMCPNCRAIEIRRIDQATGKVTVTWS